MGFPCGQFLNQEESTNEEIYKVSTTKFGVKFPLMTKCNVNGPDAHQVFKYLRSNTKELQSRKNPGKMLELPWNFCKWVVDKDGKVQMYLNPTIQLHTAYELIELLLDLRSKKGGPALLSAQQKTKAGQPKVGPSVAEIFKQQAAERDQKATGKKAPKGKKKINELEVVEEAKEEQKQSFADKKDGMDSDDDGLIQGTQGSQDAKRTPKEPEQPNTARKMTKKPVKRMKTKKPTKTDSAEAKTNELKQLNTQQSLKQQMERQEKREELEQKQQEAEQEAEQDAV